MAVANLTARGGISQGMKSGSRMYCPNAKEMTAVAAGLDSTQVSSGQDRMNKSRNKGAVR